MTDQPPQTTLLDSDEDSSLAIPTSYQRSPNRDDSDSEQELESQDPFSESIVKLNGYHVGFAEDRNKKYRRTMEDSHTIKYNFDNIAGDGFFCIFDGHAGKGAAEYCGTYLNQHFTQLRKENPTISVPELLNMTFVETDRMLGIKNLHSGCTAVVAHLTTENRNIDGAIVPKRVLYVANVGDARAVLYRNGQAVRLTYDHKGSDQAEVKRISQAGGFVINSRVNGVLAVTRSLGDLSMKEFVIGNPYTTETVLENETQLILACDGIWDVCTDQQACDMIKDIENPKQAADCLVDYALDNFSTDNLTAIVIKMDPNFLQHRS